MRSMRSPKDSTVQPVESLSKRAQRSRNKLKQAARELLNERGFRKVRVRDITERAGVAAGLFYRYFHDLPEIAYEVTKDFMDELNLETSGLPKAVHPYDQIFNRHLLAVNLFAENPGIVRCLFQLDGEYPEFGNVWKAAAHQWNLLVAEFLESSISIPAVQAEHMAFVLGAMTEGVFFQYLIRHTEDLSEMGPEPSDIAEMIALMWYRMIFMENPPENKLRFGKSLIPSPVHD
jgi:AcrR family transcriptional regulator